ncbi:MAG: hypothetical protein WCT27_04875 [Patescibacteria group bacterium]
MESDSMQPGELIFVVVSFLVMFVLAIIAFRLKQKPPHFQEKTSFFTHAAIDRAVQEGRIPQQLHSRLKANLANREFVELHWNGTEQLEQKPNDLGIYAPAPPTTGGH